MSELPVEAQSILLESLKAGASFGSYGSGADLIYWASSAPTSTDFDLGDVSYGDPYPSTWDKHVYAGSSYMNSYLLPGTATPSVLTAGISIRTAVLPTAAAPLRPLITPVLNPTINGLSLMTDRSGVGVTPTLAWQAPATGSPSGYMVTVYRLYVSGSHTFATSAATLYTTTTSVQVPPGALLAGNAYVFRIRAIQCGRDLQSAPYRLALPYGRADILTGLITP